MRPKTCITALGIGVVVMLATPSPILAQSPDTPLPSVASPAPLRNGAAPTLERRLQAMTRELGLDPTQQTRVRQLLEQQRDTIRRIWRDPSVLPAERAALTQAQTEHTGDAIRAVLTAEQKKIYNRERKDEPPPAEGKRSVEQWMDASQARRPGSP